MMSVSLWQQYNLTPMSYIVITILLLLCVYHSSLDYASDSTKDVVIEFTYGILLSI
jgi:hypothetical protein